MDTASPTADTLPIPETTWLEALLHTLQYRSRTLGLLRDLSHRYGPVTMMRTYAFPPLVSLFGPDANRFVLLDQAQQLSAKRAWDFIMGRIFANGLLLRDGADHRQHRRIMQVAFHHTALREYVDRMTPQIAGVVDGWDRQGAFLAYPAFKALTLDLACSIFLGVELGAEAQRLNAAFEATVAASMSFVRLRIPGLEFDRGMRGREFMMDLFGSMIPARRASADADMFSRLCRAGSDDGERYADAEIVDHLIFLMMAAHDTTTSTLSSLMYELARHPDWQERVREECRGLHVEAPGFDDLGGLADVDLVVKETLRLHPPLSTIPRVATRAFEFGGHCIPEGAMVAVYPLHSHYLDDWWRDPFRFDPERFAPGRAEHERHPYLFVPFGGGAHMCIGYRFAELQIKAVLFALLRRYRWSVPDGYVLPEQQAPIAKPTDGLPITLTRLD